MKISFEGIGQWAATFACTGVQTGDMVKVDGNGCVGAGGDGDAFCGQAVSLARSGDACAVQLGGFVTAAYTGDSAPALGWTGLQCDGNGGVKAATAGRSYLVVDVDTAAKAVTFAL